MKIEIELNEKSAITGFSYKNKGGNIKFKKQEDSKSNTSLNINKTLKQDEYYYIKNEMDEFVKNVKKELLKDL